MVTYDAIDRHHSDHRPPKSGTYLSLAALFSPAMRPAFEAILDGVADRGGGGLRQSELGASLRKRAGAVPFNGTLIGLNR